MTTTPPAPTLAAYTDADPCPRVEVTVTPMPGDADTITVWRSWAGRRTQVRDAVGATVAGDYFIVDYEVPTGVSVTYTCETADVNGVPSELSAGTSTTLNVTSVWMQDPLDPTTAVEAYTSLGTSGIRVIGDSFVPMTYEMPMQIVQIVGSADPIALGGTRQSPSGVPLAVQAWGDANAAAVRNLWSQAWPLCVRTPSTVPQYGGLVYLAFNFTESPYPGWDKTLFTATATAVRGPGRGIVVQPRTYTHLLDEAATYSNLVSLYPTYLDVLRGP